MKSIYFYVCRGYFFNLSSVDFEPNLGSLVECVAL